MYLWFCSLRFSIFYHSNFCSDELNFFFWERNETFCSLLWHWANFFKVIHSNPCTSNYSSYMPGVIYIGLQHRPNVYNTRHITGLIRGARVWMYHFERVGQMPRKTIKRFHFFLKYKNLYSSEQMSEQEKMVNRRPQNQWYTEITLLKIVNSFFKIINYRVSNGHGCILVSGSSENI